MASSKPRLLLLLRALLPTPCVTLILVAAATINTSLRQFPSHLQLHTGCFYSDTSHSLTPSHPQPQLYPPSTLKHQPAPDIPSHVTHSTSPHSSSFPNTCSTHSSFHLNLSHHTSSSTDASSSQPLPTTPLPQHLFPSHIFHSASPHPVSPPLPLHLTPQSLTQPRPTLPLPPITPPSTQKERKLTFAKFEALGGRGATRKWRTSIMALPDGPGDAVVPRSMQLGELLRRLNSEPQHIGEQQRVGGGGCSGGWVVEVAGTKCMAGVTGAGISR